MQGDEVVLFKFKVVGYYLMAKLGCMVLHGPPPLGEAKPPPCFSKAPPPLIYKGGAEGPPSLYFP